MKISFDVSEENEGTESPWWVIIDPQQNLSTNKEAAHRVANMVTGPFFSREAAEEHLNVRRYSFGINAVVYCMSGYWSEVYKTALRNANAQKKDQK